MIRFSSIVDEDRPTDSIVGRRPVQAEKTQTILLSSQNFVSKLKAQFVPRWQR